MANKPPCIGSIEVPVYRIDQALDFQAEFVGFIRNRIKSLFDQGIRYALQQLVKILLLADDAVLPSAVPDASGKTCRNIAIIACGYYRFRRTAPWSWSRMWWAFFGRCTAKATTTKRQELFFRKSARRPGCRPLFSTRWTGRGMTA